MKKIFLILVIYFLLHTSLFTQTYKHLQKKEITTSEIDYFQKDRIVGDTCADPFYIPSLPYSDTQNSGDFADDYEESCSIYEELGGSPDVVYEYGAATDQYINVTLCNDATDYDTKLYIYRGICPCLVEFPCNDDACSTTSIPNAFVSELTDVFLQGGSTYFIVVDGWSGAYGTYDLYVENTVQGSYILNAGVDYWSTVK